MNNDRRKRLQDAIELLEQAKGIIEDCGCEERDAFNNLPESFQWTEQGERMEEAADNLESAADDTQSVIDAVQEEVDN